MDSIIQALDRWRPDILSFTEELIATPSETPGGDERKVVQVIMDRLNKLGLSEATVVGEIPKRPNVIYRLRGRGRGPTLLYIAHTDTKPVGDARGLWETDPFTPTIKEGKLYGLGAADMKAAVSSFVYAAAALRDVGPLAGNLILALVADEEGGGRYGAHFLSSQYGLKADMAVIGEPPGVTKEWEYIHLGCRGVCCFTIKVYGRQIHSSVSDRLGAVNASVKLAELVAKMSRELKAHLRYPPHALCETGVTVNLGVILKGGVFFGVNPGYAEFGTDIRTVPGMKKEELARDLDAFLDSCRRDDPSLQVELEFARPPLDWVAPTEVNQDLPIAGALANASKKVLGFRPPYGIYPAGTDSPKFQLEAGIPTIPACGAGVISVCHGPNEWVGIESIIQAAKIYALAAHDVLK